MRHSDGGGLAQALVLWSLLAVVGQAQTETSVSQSANFAWELGPTGSRASLRGLSAASDQVVWACGSQGTVLRTTDGGSSWQEVGPAAFPDLEFRSLHAWDERNCCLASAGFPAVILRTRDGGNSWVEAFRHASEAAFIDGLRFWDASHGIAFGDPLDGRLMILESTDGGASWQAVAPAALPLTTDGEAGFAASNSALVIGPQGQAWIGTGVRLADTSRIYFRSSFEAPWKLQQCPLPSGATSGVFSIAAAANGDGVLQLVAVGGDYRQGAEGEAFDPSQLPENALTACLSRDRGSSWQAAARPPSEFRSAVVQVPDTRGYTGGWICVGPTGSDWSPDGEAWYPFSKDGFHALAIGRERVFATGADGRFAVLVGRVD